MRILIADDDPVHRRILEILLSKCNHEVTTAADGEQAWTILQRDAAPELAILDWKMPGLDGLEVCRRIRALMRIPYTYVMLMTIMRQRQDLLTGLEAGVDDYLAKPLDPPLLRARLSVAQRILELQNKVLAAHEELRFQATHDPLTGLPNRASVLAALEREIQRSRRENHPLGVMLAEVDHIKRLNDKYSYVAGDRALVEAARRISMSIRIYDSIGRFGGREFLIVMPGCDAQTTLKQAERLRECVAGEPLDLAGESVPLSMSIGVASAGLCLAGDAAALILAAGDALRRAKRAGRNRVQLFAGDPGIPVACDEPRA